MGLIDELPSGPVAIDTAVIIYFVERQPQYVEVVRPIFEAADRGELALVASALTLMEVLVVPFRAADGALAARYEALLTKSRGLSLVALDTAVLRGAAHIRASRGVRVPDAIQLACALSHGCTAFLTNDKRLPELPSLRIFQLADYV